MLGVMKVLAYHSREKTGGNAQLTWQSISPPRAWQRPVRVRHGAQLWRELIDHTGIEAARAVGMFDQHQTVDELWRRQGMEVGDTLDQQLDTVSVICSFGCRNRKRL